MPERRRTVGRVCACIAGFATLAVAGSAPAFASTVTANFNFLEIQGDGDSDRITLSQSGGTLTIVDTGAGGVTTSDPGCTQVNPTTVTCPVDDGSGELITGFGVSLGDGVDSFTNQDFAAQFGQVLAFNATGAKTVAGGPGPQFIGGGLDNDTLDGGAGDDNLNDGSGESGETAGNDLLVGGPGVDSTQYARDADVGLDISLDGAANDGVPGEADNVQTEDVVAGDGNDTLTGDDGENQLTGLGGADLIRGRSGNDTLFGDSVFSGGLAMLRGGAQPFAGDDTLDGGAGRDLYDCGRGFDLALREPLDEVRNDCERTGAEVVGDSAQLGGKKKNRFKALLTCPAPAVDACSGTLRVTASGKKLGKGKFSVAAGETKGAKAKLSKKGVKAVRRAGGALLVSVEAETSESGGSSIDRGRILIHD